ncbi:hypothetical protein P7H22_24835 [Paenibacillus larvae]|nr:hypothetical protein [Paenibacillus larvae]MDT2242912.1 hypothetical protein [Paenibacillus larvae]
MKTRSSIRTLKWLVSKSLEIEDPLLDRNKKKSAATYDFVSQRVIEYHELAKMYPGLHAIYKQLGWNYVGSPEPEQKQPEAPKKKKNLDFFFDD